VRSDLRLIATEFGRREDSESAFSCDLRGTVFVDDLSVGAEDGDSDGPSEAEMIETSSDHSSQHTSQDTEEEGEEDGEDNESVHSDASFKSVFSNLQSEEGKPEAGEDPEVKADVGEDPETAEKCIRMWRNAEVLENDDILRPGALLLSVSRIKKKNEDGSFEPKDGRFISGAEQQYNFDIPDTPIYLGIEDSVSRIKTRINVLNQLVFDLQPPGKNQSNKKNINLDNVDGLTAVQLF
jgi:hypothetical protein